MIMKGFRFGMMLQLAIGPVCLFIFQTGVASGFRAALSGVLGTVAVDGCEIVLAILGVGALLQKSRNARTILQYGGAAVLVLFGLSNIAGAFSGVLLPKWLIRGLNAAVGCVMVWFGVKNACKE